MRNPMLGAPLAVVVDVPAYVGRTRTVAPISGLGSWQNSARLQSALPIAAGMRPAVADAREYAATGSPKHAPRAFALSAPRTWSPPV